MLYTKATNPQWFNAEHTSIYLLVTFNKIGTVPFLATSLDCEAHGREIFEHAASGRFGEVAPYVEVVVSIENLTSDIRSKRDKLLLETDWTQLFDVPQVTIEKWQPYRQALRDITLQTGFPVTIDWPIKPV